MAKRKGLWDWHQVTVGGFPTELVDVLAEATNLEGKIDNAQSMVVGRTINQSLNLRVQIQRLYF
jgi:hypothetical protein